MGEENEYAALTIDVLAALAGAKAEGPKNP